MLALDSIRKREHVVYVRLLLLENAICIHVCIHIYISHQDWKIEVALVTLYAHEYVGSPHDQRTKSLLKRPSKLPY